MPCFEVERRQSTRATVAFVAAIGCGPSSGTIKLRNMSSIGAMVEGETLPIPGSSVRLLRNDLPVMGHVVWAQGKRGGIRFDEPMNFAAYLRSVPRPRALPQLGSRRPGLKCTPLSHSERCIMEQWASSGLSVIGE